MTLAVGLALVAALAVVLIFVAILQRLLKLALVVALIGTAAAAGWWALRDVAPAPVREAVVNATTRVEAAGAEAAQELAKEAAAKGKEAAVQARDAAVKAAEDAMAPKSTEGATKTP